tara:strand:+ start:1173 stop:1607 length:435 start_codon:yes stop_codon:yes gene_type:complete
MSKKFIEVLLREIGFSNDTELTMSFLVTEDESEKTKCQWVVSSTNCSHEPVAYYDESEGALREFKKRCGEQALGGQTIISNEIHGTINGDFDSPRTEGFRVVKKDPALAQLWRDKILKVSSKDTIIGMKKKGKQCRKTLKLNQE